MEKLNLQELRADKERLEQTINDLLGTFLKKHELLPREVVIANPSCYPSATFNSCPPDSSYHVCIRFEI